MCSKSIQAMVDQLAFTPVNQKRIQLVESSFGPSSKPLATHGRVLIGEGCLEKRSRHRLQPKVFFLFNDVLVYGSIIVPGRWHKNQQIIPLEDIELEDFEDSVRMKNQWLIRMPHKSFYVAAASSAEKREWMEHIEGCRLRLLQSFGRRPSATLAVTWIPNQASAVCMRCCSKFTTTHWRHHCRNCGFLVCGPCSRRRAVLCHIHGTKRQRVCGLCHAGLRQKEEQREREEKEGESAGVRGDGVGKRSSTEEIMALWDDETSSDEEDQEECGEPIEAHAPHRCLQTQASWSSYCTFTRTQNCPV